MILNILKNIEKIRFENGRLISLVRSFTLSFKDRSISALGSHTSNQDRKLYVQPNNLRVQ